MIQKTEFSNDLHHLKGLKTVSSSSSLKSLNPFLDSSGIIRVGGRLQHSPLTDTIKHPILLPSRHHVTECIIRTLHKEHLHIGEGGLTAIIRQRYWPINVRSTVRKVTRTCVRCFKVNPASVTQLMGQLPSQRVQENFPFLKTGIDFGGPFLIKQGGPRSTKLVKAYLALFVCEATKALHLEVVSDLSSAAFIAALHRFISRRGICSDLFSDNGTNFVGANKELKQLHDQFKKEQHQHQMLEFCTSKGITWHFNPAGSPHFGGLFEAGIKQAKVHLRRVAGLANLTFEELTTMFAQIEAVLNSRPLTAMTQDPNDLTVLTPGHFLLGREVTAIPEPSLVDHNTARLSRFQRISQLKQHFWKRWHIEYLTQLQQRRKWQKGTTSIQPGQLVIIKDENLPPLKWKLGRIVTTHPGTDGIVRSVTIKTSSGLFTRATTKICILPAASDDTAVSND